jgi:hypothetical protein
MKGVLITVVGLVLAVVVWHLRMNFPFDDSFITFRYAKNLATGHGFVWNVGGEHTEGFTNFLYIVLLVPAFWLHIDPLMAAQVSNALAVVISAVLIYKIGARLITSEFNSDKENYALIPALLYLATPLVWINAFSAMETSVFGLSVLFTLYKFTEAFYRQEPESSFSWVFFWGLLTALIRPEGAVLAPILWAILMILGRSRIRVTRSFLLFYVLPVFIFHLWRHWYFGDWVPNSFLIKVINPQADQGRLLHGRAYVIMFLSAMSALLASTVGLLYLRKSWKVTWALLAWSILVLFFYMLPDPLMGLYDRFVYSVEVVLFALAGVGLYGLLAGRSRVLQIVVIVLIVAVHGYLAFYSPRARESRSSNDDEYKQYRKIAEIMNTIPDHEHIAFAFSDAGVIPFYSGMKHIDLVGLNNNAIARSHTTQDVLGILKQSKPDLIFVPVSLPGPNDDSCRRIFRAGYGLLGQNFQLLVGDTSFSQYRQIVMLHSDIYDIAVLSDIYGSHAREIEAAFRSRMLSEPKLISLPTRCLD